MATTEGDVPDGNDLPVNLAGGDGGEKKSCDESKPSCPARLDVKMFGNNTTVDDKAAVKFEDGSQEDKDSTHNAGQDVELTRDIPSLHDEAGGCGEEKTCATQPAGQDVEVIRDDSSAIDGAYVGKEKSREDSHKSCNADQAVKKKDASMKTSNAKKKDTKKSKDGWVCPDTGCRKRNSSEDATCTKCGLIQSFRAEARYSRKARVSGLVVTHVCSPVSLYVQTPQQQRDYARVRSRMAEMYANAAYRPSRIVPNMVLGMKCDGGYERVRTVRTVPGVKATLDHGTATVNLTAEGIDKEAPKAAPSSPGGGTSLKWRVQLMDRGSWCEALEDDFNFLLSGLSDLKPLAAMFSLNELRVARGATEAQIEESRAWLEQELSSGVIEGDVYKQTRNQWSPPSLDLFKDGTLINKALLRFAAVESTAKSKILKADVVGAHAPSAADEGTSLQPSAADEGTSLPPSESEPSSEVPMLNMALRQCSYCHQEGHYEPSCRKFIADCNEDPTILFATDE
ncbi:uncharacterized protein LOC108683033 isoform X1 [Hyalella azteca]|uniref:Uncharacterized protein LOC108683033 isoform X1 n=1 Tax=Hyalella azteca TaxID=294128 RepID=A0A8B7PQQ0_HYAAZ|nr:uncharacterized protein LOC108683033 isoform X1 [Hyalella azteca]XP_047740595.1 uncharacterized protein LOC108683033 isoform X1 [Hyalella azteca]